MSTSSKPCCGINFIKNVLNVFNLLSLIAGLGILGVSIWTMVDRYQYVSLLASITYPIIVYFLLCAGSLVVCVAFMGCFAVLRESRPLLLCYIFLLVLIFLMEAIVGVLAFIYEDNVNLELTLTLNNTMMESYRVDQDKTLAVDFLQQNFQCCGAETFSDWQHSVWQRSGDTYQLLHLQVPDSCCKSVTPNCGVSTHPSNIYYAGCLERMARHMEYHLVLLSAVGLGICVLQLFGVVYACQLYLRFKYSYSVDTHRNLYA